MGFGKNANYSLKRAFDRSRLVVSISVMYLTLNAGIGSLFVFNKKKNLVEKFLALSPHYKSVGYL